MMVDEPRYIRLDGITSSDPTELFEPAAFEALSQELLSPDSCQLHPCSIDVAIGLIKASRMS